MSSACCLVLAVVGIGLVLVLARRLVIAEARKQSEIEGAEMRYFFDRSLDMLCIAGNDGYFKKVNPAWSKALGYTIEELTSVPYISFIHPDDVQATIDEAAKVSTGVDTIWFQNRYRCKDGSYKWLAWQATAAVERKVLYAAARDITEQKASEDSLKSLAVKLKRSNDDLSQFAYVASHDLQEPLRMISSYLQLIARRYTGRLDMDADKFINFAVDGARRMQQLIQDLLAYSRVGTQSKPMQVTSMEAVLKAVLENLRLAISEAGAEVTHDPLPEVMADSSQMTLLLQNLISNAIKFRVGEPPRIHVSCSRDDEGWTFVVSDNGIGIDEQFHDRIFAIFQRLHTRDEYPGTGIGLAICKKIVERHGGCIWMESETGGKGTRFYFVIPVNSHPPPAR